MSIEAVATVLNHSKARGRAKLVLIGIANHLGDQGAWPSISTLSSIRQRLRAFGQARHSRANESWGAASRPSVSSNEQPIQNQPLLDHD
jgi:hypothetical protein